MAHWSLIFLLIAAVGVAALGFFYAQQATPHLPVPPLITVPTPAQGPTSAVPTTTQQSTIQATTSTTQRSCMDLKSDRKQETASAVVNDRLGAGYTVLKIIKNSFAPNFLIVVTEAGYHGGCGSVYTSPNCYFFVVSACVQGDQPAPRFLGKWNSNRDIEAIYQEMTSFVFLNAENIQFNSLGVGDGYSVQTVWNLNLQSGAFKKLHATTTTGLPL
jgi:hypothetical protein